MIRVCKSEMNFFIFIWLSVVFQGRFLGSHGTLTCRDAYECASQSHYLSAQVYCWGYFSCANTTLETNSSSVSCDGSHACFGASITIVPQAAHISCHGLFSCQNANIIHDSVSTTEIINVINCLAEGSCLNASIHIENITRLYCDAYRACANAMIDTNADVYLWGAWSAQNAVFNARDMSNFDFVGSYAGDGAIIYCQENSTCEIFCHVNSCNNMKAVCVGNCSLHVTCDESAEMSDLCPDGIIVADLNPLVIVPNLTQFAVFSNEINSVDTCNFNESIASNGVICDDYLECGYGSDVTDNAPICCLAWHSCRNAKNITSLIEFGGNNTNDYSDRIIVDENTNSNYVAAIRCDGGYSCYNVNATVKSYTLIEEGFDNDNNNISINLYFTGAYGLITTISGVDTQVVPLLSGDDLIIDVDFVNDVYCSGHRSCYNVDINGGNNLYSVARSAIWGTTIQNFNNVYFYGRTSCNNGTIINVNTAYCATQVACGSCQWYNIDRIIARGHWAALGNNFNGINDYLFGYGHGAFQSATITGNNSNETVLDCYGSLCLGKANISNIDTVTCAGEYCMFEASMNSIRSQVNVIGRIGLQDAVLNNSAPGFDNSNFMVCVWSSLFFFVLHLCLCVVYIAWE